MARSIPLDFGLATGWVVSVPPEVVPADVCGLGGVVETGVVVNELEGTVEAGVVVVSDLDEGGIYPELDAALFLLPLVPGALYVALKLPAGLVFAPGGL